jgi:hypothetical protein
LGRLDQGLVGQCGEENDCVEEVGLSNAVRTGNACERPKSDVDVVQILESLDFEAG